MRYVFDRCPKCDYQFDVADFTENGCFIQDNFEDVFTAVCPKCRQTLFCRQHKEMKFDFEATSDSEFEDNKNKMAVILDAYAQHVKGCETYAALNRVLNDLDNTLNWNSGKWWDRQYVHKGSPLDCIVPARHGHDGTTGGMLS